MRHIGTVPDLELAEVFSDYLANRGISAHIEPQGSAWAVWVREEDQLAESRSELERFLKNPADEEIRWQAAGQRQARQIRKAEQVQQAASPATRIVKPAAKRWKLSTIPKRAPLTLSLILLCMLVAVASNLGHNLSSAAMESLMFCNPDHFADAEWQANSDGTVDIRRGEVWRLATPIFLHFGLPHIAFNLLLLFQLGLLFESRQGSMRLFLIVIVTGIAGNLGQYFCDGSTLFGGLSGAIYGLVAFAWVRSRRAPAEGLRISNEVLILLLLFLVLGFSGVMDQLLSNESSQVSLANWAHLFGMLAGVALAWVLPDASWTESTSPDFSP